MVMVVYIGIKMSLSIHKQYKEIFMEKNISFILSAIPNRDTRELINHSYNLIYLTMRS